MSVKVKRLFIWLKCLFKHDWLYDSPGPRNGEWHRECHRCGKRQHATYDMMYGSTDCKRQFIQLSRAWYAGANLRGGEVIDEITMGFYHKDGGTTGEFTIRWIELSGSETPMLCCFDGSWHAMWQFRDVLEKMAEIDGTNPTPNEICRILVSCGVADNTPENLHTETVK